MSPCQTGFTSTHGGINDRTRQGQMWFNLDQEGVPTFTFPPARAPNRKRGKVAVYPSGVFLAHQLRGEDHNREQVEELGAEVNDMGPEGLHIPDTGPSSRRACVV